MCIRDSLGGVVQRARPAPAGRADDGAPPQREQVVGLALAVRRVAAGVTQGELRVQHRRHPQGAGEPYDLLARRRRAVVGATRGRRARALDDAAQAITFASRAAGHALLGGDAGRPLRQLQALSRAVRG